MPDNQGYIDIHSHFLPSLDDGPETSDQCLEAALRYRQIGVGCVIATPHHIPGTRWAASAEQVERCIEETRQRLSRADIDLTILPGMEITLTEDMCRCFETDNLLPLGPQGVFLIELSLNATHEDPVCKGLQNLLSQNTCRFILAHPERCRLFQENPERLHFFIGQGMLLQVNIGSVLGLDGRRAQQTAFDLFREGMVHFLATDSHARADRQVPDARQMEQLNMLLGEETVRGGFQTNPVILLQGGQVPPLRTEKIPAGAEPLFLFKKNVAEHFRKLFRGN